ncbi:response regulator transcription factor [Roseomonas sp. JC162]|uniref:Response regulator transcription factor n=1 Tax=Neoroseomonas marina TaxID=1232220 RepID=A0A848E761_9PROT|nr:response regulator transcription factor [Neoroseomonas marina]NMJ40241.1 response regulator transcription factor [Neoroseomonas marina]
MKILVIEDDRATAAWIAAGLAESGHTVDHAETGRDGLFLAGSEPYDAIIADRMLPGMDGIGIVRTLRSTGVTTPILMLTALGELDHRIEGLEAGADDYLAKPFSFRELRARLSAIVRRGERSVPDQTFRAAGLELDPANRSVRSGPHRVALRPTEFRILDVLMRHAGSVVTRDMLLQRVWNYHFDPTTNVVDPHITRLRRKLETGGIAVHLRNVRGLGFLLEAAASPLA